MRNGAPQLKRGLMVEGLESREMLSGNSGFGGLAAFRGAVASHGHPALVSSAIAGQNFTAAAFRAFAAHERSESDVTRLSATLTSDGAGSGTAQFKSEVENGTTEQYLTVKVTGAAASTTLNVTVDETLLGTLTTDADGNGIVKFATTSSSDSVIALPTGFVLNEGSKITVGDAISGSFATSTTGTCGGGEHGRGGGDESDITQTRLTADLTNGDTAAGRAVYHAVTYEGSTRQALRVRVTGLAASTTFNVSVDDTVIGTLTTDANGNGRARFSSNPHNSNVQQLPDGFTLSAGATIKVGDTVIGTFA